MVNAYYTIPILDQHKDFLKFEFEGKLFRFTCLPNGYSYGPRVFTKILKPPLSQLRAMGVNVTAYLDDFINMHIDHDKCLDNTRSIIDMFQNLGFFIHPEPKSCFVPSQTITFLGFIINSTDMTVRLTSEKITALIALNPGETLLK